MSTVRSIEFRDYKSFPSFTLSAKERNVLVGPNNAGKSTTLDAFRITFDALKFAARRTPNLKTQAGHGVCATWMVPSTLIQNDLRSCIHNFGEGPARITIKLDNGNSFVIAAHSEGDAECFLATDVAGRKSTAFLRERYPLKLVIVPTLSPLEQNEELVLQETVERNRYGRLASRNFRNFWLHRSEAEFLAFAELVEFGWPGVKLRRPEIEHGGPRPIVRMYFRDGANVREVQSAGFGFQVWMQTMMHLCGADKDSTLVLDEPDIYLHPDLQHRLLTLIGQRVGQYFVATHSTEIINNAEPGDVLVIRPGSRGAKRIQSDRGYSEIYSAIGSSENAQFARLAKTKKVLYFEGNDARILRKIAQKKLKADFISNSNVTLMKTDGFANWSRVTTSSWVFENFFGFQVPVAAVFDRDYRCDEEIAEFLDSTNTENALCRVLPFKELENVLLVERAVCGVIEKYTQRPLPADYVKQVSDTFQGCLEKYKLKTLIRRIGHKTEYEARKGGRNNMTTVSVAEEEAFNRAWQSDEFKRSVVPGKEAFSEIASAVQDRFAVSLTPSRIIDELQIAEINPDLFRILEDIRMHLGE